MSVNTISIQYFKTPFGELIHGDYNGQLCLCDWRYRKMRSSIDHRIQKELEADYVEGDTPVIQSTIQQITEYFQEDRTEFDLPLLLVGTDFQKRVWDLLLQIPFGEKETYLGLSKKLGDEKAIRAVASANGANAISIIVPCHRIVGSNGELVGYAGGLSTKKKLLQLEGALTRNEQLNLFQPATPAQH